MSLLISKTSKQCIMGAEQGFSKDVLNIVITIIIIIIEYQDLARSSLV